MLKKLLRYEFKSVSRILVPAILGTIALALLTSILLTINYRSLSSSKTESIIDGEMHVSYSFSFSDSIISIILTTLMVFTVIAIIASIFVIGFILLQRYYKNFFGDEGYLTFTLPVKTSQHLTAKLISGVVWMVLGGLAVLISVLLLVIFGTAESGQIINTEIFTVISDLFKALIEQVGTGNAIAYIFELLILILVECTAQMLLFYLAITIGSIIARKHKIIASAGVFLGINAAAGTVLNIGLALVFNHYDLYTSNDISVLTSLSHWSLILFIVLYLVLSVAAFIIINDLLKKKLNLE